MISIKEGMWVIYLLHMHIAYKIKEHTFVNYSNDYSETMANSSVADTLALTWPGYQQTR